MTVRKTALSSVTMRIAATIFAALLLFNCTALAAVNSGDTAVPYYDHTRIVTAALSFGSGTARCAGTIAASEVDCDISMTLRLWKLNDDNVWSVVKTWTASASNVDSYGIDKTYSISAGSYKVSVSGTVTTSSGARENVSKSTPSKTYNP